MITYKHSVASQQYSTTYNAQCNVFLSVGCLQYYDSVNGKIQSFNFEGMIRNLEPCYNGTEPECGQELFTGTEMEKCRKTYFPNTKITFCFSIL